LPYNADVPLRLFHSVCLIVVVRFAIVLFDHGVIDDFKRCGLFCAGLFTAAF
jgi:hypothetical protein